jgi:hypothetical protein
MAEEPGHLFLEADDEELAKAALVLGLQVVSVDKSFNTRLVLDEKVRGSRRFHTLPLEPESLLGFFGGRGSGLTDEQIENAAKNGHEKYAQRQIATMRKGGATPSDLGERVASWDRLDPKYKSSNIDQAAYAPIIFERAGYALGGDPTDAVAWASIPQKEREALARLEHGRWNAERVKAGWSYFPQRDNERLLQPFITAFDDLPEEIQAYDFYGVDSLIDNLAQAGLFLHKKG